MSIQYLIMLPPHATQEQTCDSQETRKARASVGEQICVERRGEEYWEHEIGQIGGAENAVSSRVRPWYRRHYSSQSSSAEDGSFSHAFRKKYEERADAKGEENRESVHAAVPEA